MSISRRSVSGRVIVPAPTRREVLGGMVSVAALGAGASTTLPRVARAQQAVHGTTCMTILYPNAPDVTFDFDYYREHHLPMITGPYGDSIRRLELRRAVTGGPGPQPPYVAVVNIWVADDDAFAAHGQQHSQALIDDIPNFSNVMPVIQSDVIHGTDGDPAEAIGEDESCLTILYPNSDDVHWDVEYYRAVHQPLIMDLYGDEAISRFELRRGEAAADGSPAPYIGSINIYIRDQAAFDAAGAEHGQTLVEDVPNFSSVMPIAFQTTVVAVGQN